MKATKNSSGHQIATITILLCTTSASGGFAAGGTDGTASSPPRATMAGGDEQKRSTEDEAPRGPLPSADEREPAVQVPEATAARPSDESRPSAGRTTTHDIANLTGRVLEAGSREPLEGVSVRIEGSSADISTGELGEFRVTGLPPGPARLKLALPGYQSLEVTAKIEPGKQTVGIYYLYHRPDRRFALEVKTQRERTEVIQHSFTMEEVRSTPGTFGALA